MVLLLVLIIYEYFAFSRNAGNVVTYIGPMSSQKEQETIHQWVKEYYGELLKSSADLKTNACCATGAPPLWLAQLLQNVHEDVLSRFYGCGFPIPEALEGATVMDLGCGTGRDVYLLAQLVGQEGRVIGVDMTKAQLDTANETLKWHMDRFSYKSTNTEFHQGYIEDLSSLPVESGEVDIIVSNCVVNLSPRKDLVLAEAARMLKTGGELYISDVFADRRLPEEVASDSVLFSECLGGAMYMPDFLAMAKAVGFADPRIVSSDPITIQNDEIIGKVGAARFDSVTLRLLKLPELEPQCEDFGQIATYKGTIYNHESLFRLDSHHLFEAGRPERICGNTADMLRESRLAPHFDVVGDKSVHYGVFDCSETMAQAQYKGQGSLAGTPISPVPASSGGCC